jgi:hypothetical protein
VAGFKERLASVGMLFCCCCVIWRQHRTNLFYFFYIFLNLLILGLIAAENYGLRSMSETLFARLCAFAPAPALLFLCHTVHAAAQGLQRCHGGSSTCFLLDSQTHSPSSSLCVLILTFRLHKPLQSATSKE